jgi:hypothetical protein
MASYYQTQPFLSLVSSFLSYIPSGRLFFNHQPESPFDGCPQAPQPIKFMEKQADDAYYAAVSEAAKETRSEKAVSRSSLPHQPDELELAGLIAPTEEEMNTLRHVPDKIDWTAYSEGFIRISPVYYSRGMSDLIKLRSDCLC